MPLYEYRCRTCDEVFEVRRPMADSDRETSCPAGHDGAVRLLSVFASVGAGNAPAASAMAPSSPCGGACACAAR